MAAQSSDLDDQKAGATIQMETHTLTPQNGQNGPKEMEASGSAPSHSPSQIPVRRQMPACPKTWYCLEIQVILTKDGGATPPLPHAWQAAVVEDMLQDGKSGLTEAVVMGLCWAILFYGRQSLGEGLSLSDMWDTMFTLSGAISWVGKQAQLSANTLSLLEGQQLIAQAITKWCIEARGPGHANSHLPALLPFRFCNQDGLLQEERLHRTNECMVEPRHAHQTSRHEQGWVPQCGKDHGQMQWDPWAALTQKPSLDCGFESDRSSMSTSSSVSSRFDRSGGSRCMHHGQCSREPGGYMKMNLQVFKDKDKKDAITYQSWCWDLMVYHHAGCWNCTLLPIVSAPYRAILDSWEEGWEQMLL